RQGGARRACQAAARGGGDAGREDRQCRRTGRLDVLHRRGRGHRGARRRPLRAARGRFLRRDGPARPPSAQRRRDLRRLLPSAAAVAPRLRASAEQTARGPLADRGGGDEAQRREPGRRVSHAGEDASRPVPGARPDLSQPRHVAASQDGGRRLRLDAAGAWFAEAAKVRRVEHAGKFFKSRGPLNVVRSPQDGPVILQAGTSPKGIDFAARYADAIFAIQPRPQDAKRYFDTIKGRMAEFGRPPEHCRILFGAQPILGASEAEAREKQEEHNGLVPLEGGMTILSAHADYDLSKI